MRTSRIAAAAVSLIIVAGAVGAASHGMADATAQYGVCKNTQLSYTRQNQCIDEMRSAKSDAVRQEVDARYQNIITAKVAAEEGVSLPSSRDN